MMHTIILDCDLMKHAHSGLYHYCLNVGLAVNQLLPQMGNLALKMYVPPQQKEAFEGKVNAITERAWHRLWRPFLNSCAVWHAPFQSGRMIPDKKRHPGIKVLLTIHDLNPLHEGKPQEEQQRSLLHTQGLIDQSDAIVCISEFTKSDVLKHCATGNKPVVVIHNGIHRLHAEPSVPQQVSGNRPFLFGMGYVNRKKNFHVLLPLLKHNPGLELVIAGRLDDPDYVSAMKTAAEAMQVSDQLRLTGPVPEAEKSWYLANCLAFVHPSLAEGFGAPVVEAMHFGKPLFLSNRTALTEIGGDIAFYFSSFEETHLQQVFSDGMATFRRLGMGPAVMARGHAFNWQKSAAQYINVYQSLID
ncbi:glycosyltransferase family 4 protein [Taibaiella koreensis]|uniref:glycosyltransferase family 4 protein n=1 Tax=Taibaiella koreensis TaxID=1268548 RepID=UPI000E59A522|nr:glycosyltransferase family 1 protein [Taibaiella koreensis]